ncbi:MAG: tRNA (adenine-N1)-methyltransferase [Actinomycetota bacterium]
MNADEGRNVSTGGAFVTGDRVLLLDRKARRYLLKLRTGAQFHSHRGYVDHDSILGEAEGVAVQSSGGATFVAVRPSLTDFVLKMPRGAQVVYPKDIGAIIIGADIYPGATVIEAGTGSGALTIGLLRAVGAQGRVVTYEKRPEFAERARLNIESFFGRIPASLDMRDGDLADADLTGPADRIVLDMPEPWRIIPFATRVLRPGGVFCSYVPTVLQFAQVTEELRAAGFIEVVTSETLVRTWHVEGQSVRPDHRMVAHTGFLTMGRYMGAPAPDAT